MGTFLYVWQRMRVRVYQRMQKALPSIATCRSPVGTGTLRDRADRLSAVATKTIANLAWSATMVNTYWRSVAGKSVRMVQAPRRTAQSLTNGEVSCLLAFLHHLPPARVFNRFLHPLKLPRRHSCSIRQRLNSRSPLQRLQGIASRVAQHTTLWHAQHWQQVVNSTASASARQQLATQQQWLRPRALASLTTQTSTTLLHAA